MGVVTWIRKKPRLSTIVDQPGGMSARSAMKAADELLEPMREEGRRRVEAAIAILEASIASPEDQDRASLLGAIYAQSNAVLDAAGPFGLEDLCAAAYSLCELVDRYGRTDAPIDSRALEVHVQALRLLNALDTTPAAARQVVLDGLGQVLGRVPA